MCKFLDMHRLTLIATNLSKVVDPKISFVFPLSRLIINQNKVLIVLRMFGGLVFLLQRFPCSSAYVRVCLRTKLQTSDFSVEASQTRVREGAAIRVQAV